MSNTSYFDKLQALSSVVQILNLIMNVEQTSNDDVMDELEKQQNFFLSQLVNNQKEILSRLESIENKVNSMTYTK